MKHTYKLAMGIFALSSLALTACGGPASSPSENVTPETSGPNTENTENTEKPSATENEEHILDQDVLDRFKEGNIRFTGSVSRIADGAGNIYNTDIHFSEGRYHFVDTLGAYKIYNSDIKIFRDSKGNAMTKMLLSDNTVKEENLYYSSNNKPVAFDSRYSNPFNFITEPDIYYSRVDQSYHFLDTRVRDNFFSPISYYMEIIKDLTLKYNRSEDNFEIVYQSSGKDYTTYGKGVITLTDEVVEDVVPYEHQPYHDALKTALKEMSECHNYTYEVTRTNLENTDQTKTISTYYTEEAILYPADYFVGRVNPYGIATFNDGSVRQFEVVDGKVVPGYTDEKPYPQYDAVSVELYQQKDENTYYIDDYGIGSIAAAYMANTRDELLLISQFGIKGNFEITLKDGKLDRFTYVVMGIYESGIVPQEKREVIIKEVNNTSLDSKLEFVVPDKEETLAKYVGTYEGTNLIGDKAKHTLVIQQDGSVLLDDKTAEAVTFDVLEGFEFKVGTITYQATLKDDGTMFIRDRASSYLNMNAVKIS